MLEPKKQKFRKRHKGRARKRAKETRGIALSHGSIGIQALGTSWVTARQIEAVRKTIAHTLKKEGKVWIRVFPDKPVTKFPPEVTMGGGKGDVDHHVVSVRPGRVLFEIDGVEEEMAREALTKAGHKLPIKTRIITKE
ncbi:50S ribosomal protein L16 [bacterium]|nr:50S ribosomal protein L16 [bacterium]|tara:strand:- start:706 stop:1119 length:414 start_codon:yes stop_codon:yes gene_type:complete